METLEKKNKKIQNLNHDIPIFKPLSPVEINSYPGKKHEDYKYCDLSQYFNASFNESIQFDEAELNNLLNKTISEFNITNKCYAVVVNGKFIPKYSRLDNEDFIVNEINDEFIKTNPLAQHIGKAALNDDDVTVKINSEKITSGLYISIPAKVVANEPLSVIYLSCGSEKLYFHSRAFIHAEKNSNALVKFIFTTSGMSAESFHNHVAEFYCEENSQLKTITVQDEKLTGHLVCNTFSKQNKYSYFSNHMLTLSGKLVRNNTQCKLSEENCEAHLYGMYLTDDKQLVDNHTVVDHQVPNCFSNELYLGVLDNKSTGVFNGKIWVKKDAQKTNAYQSNKNILLSPLASINTKPQLEIYANDVKCSHGTTTGKLDQSALFYLKSRGIGESKAKKLLLMAFLNDVVQTIPSDNYREIIRKNIEQRLG